MMLCVLIRFRASLMGDAADFLDLQRINDGGHRFCFLLLPGPAFLFFGRRRMGAIGGSPPSWRRQLTQPKRGDATHARICLSL